MFDHNFRRYFLRLRNTSYCSVLLWSQGWETCSVVRRLQRIQVWFIKISLVEFSFSALFSAQPEQRPQAKVFTYSEILTATRNFSENNILRRGPVFYSYSGLLSLSPNQTARVEIKRLTNWGFIHVPESFQVSFLLFFCHPGHSSRCFSFLHVQFQWLFCFFTSFFFLHYHFT